MYLTIQNVHWVYSRNLYVHRTGMQTCTHECRARMWIHMYTKHKTNTFMHRKIWRSWTKWLLKLSNPHQKLKTCDNSSQNSPTSQIVKICSMLLQTVTHRHLNYKTDFPLLTFVFHSLPSTCRNTKCWWLYHTLQFIKFPVVLNCLSIGYCVKVIFLHRHFCCKF
jgi:hypothetical protein